MAKYMILLYGNEQRWASTTAEQREAVFAAHAAFGEKAGSAILGGEELEPSTTATSLRPDGDRVTTTDGPFLETKEALGGFYLVEAPDLDAAIALASLLPEAGDDHGGVEIRPVADHG